MKSYDFVKNIYEYRHNIDGYIVDLLADYDILYYCVTGLSNKVISELLDIDEEDVKNTLINRFNFSGWKVTLNFSPIYIFNRSNGFETVFYKALLDVYNMPKYIAKTALRICKIFVKYENLIDEKFK